MNKIILRTFLGLLVAVFILEIPSAHAVFGIRAARAALAARKARERASSSPDHETVPQVKEKTSLKEGSEGLENMNH